MDTTGRGTFNKLHLSWATLALPCYQMKKLFCRRLLPEAKPSDVDSPWLCCRCRCSLLRPTAHQQRQRTGPGRLWSLLWCITINWSIIGRPKQADTSAPGCHKWSPKGCSAALGKGGKHLPGKQVCKTTMSKPEHINIYLEDMFAKQQWVNLNI